MILYCERGNLSLLLARDLSNEGYMVKNIYGGLNAYRGYLEQLIRQNVNCSTILVPGYLLHWLKPYDILYWQFNLPLTKG